MKIYDQLVDQKAELAVIGLGYVGLPIALEFAKKIKVTGFDINPSRVEMMQTNIDPSNELVSNDFDGCDIKFTNKLEDLKNVKFFVVAVPTPIDQSKEPNIKPLLSASKTVGQVLKKGDYVVYESTVYPGCTEEDCVPVLENESGLVFNQDFKVGYSPERINPGDKEHTLSSIIKVSSGCDAESAEEIAKTYELVVAAGVHRASSIKVAEAAKIIENTQRDVNIALINELSMIFNKMDINTYEVLEAAGTKWNFLKFQPGLVGGHCIGVDPYYLAFKSEELGYTPEMILAGRRINDSMPTFIVSQIVKQLMKQNKNSQNASALILGATFKENCPDLRNSKVVDVYQELNEFGFQVEVYDPEADAEVFVKEYSFEKLEALSDKKYDVVILAVSHDCFKKINPKELIVKDGVVFDVKGFYKDPDFLYL